MGDEMGLFGKAPSRKGRAAPVAATAPGEVHKLLTQYRDSYTVAFGEPPVVYKSDGKVLKELVAQFGMAKVQRRLAAFLAWEDEYVRQSGYALHVFHRQWNRLAAHEVPARPQGQRVPGVDATERYLKGLSGGTP